ncbi:MAG: BTAD domain-containing putative transcriptional regulator [Eubacteriales bacterium]|nr:BTAD domain-containing putative transcriptional regulator [Eubacteriales bacterium]
MAATTTEKRENVLHVKMLGGFSMSYNGKVIAGSSKSSITQNNALLQILIHSRRDGVTRDRLEELLFGDREVDNAHHSLRSVIYNAKKHLEKAGLPKVNFITSEKDVFYWTDEIEVEEDAYEFERLHREAEQESDPGKRLESFLKASYQYGGEFLPMQTNNVWAVRESMRYEKLFADCVENAGKILREMQDYGRMKELGQYASAIAPLSDWESLTMEALVCMRKYDEAIRLYENTVSYYLDELGVHPSGRIVEWFEHLGKGLSHQHSVLEDLKKDLDGNDGAQEGGYLCSYPVFQGIYRTNRRLLDSTGASSCLMLCTLLDSKGNPMKDGSVLERLSDRLVDSVRMSVRRGDALCAYGRGQCLILLVNTTKEGCGLVQQRINRNFIVGRQRISIRYDVSSVCPDEHATFRKSS